MSEALRFNNDKPMMSYFMRSFPKMAEAVARVKEMGAIKYNDGNWKLGNKPDNEYWDSMFRHLNYIFDGEEYDKDTGCLHIAHAVWNLCALLELNYPDLPARDDEIWAERAVHWAEEKRKREASDEAEGRGCLPCSLDRGEAAEQPTHPTPLWPKAWEACWAEENKEQKVSDANAVDTATEDPKNQSHIESVLDMFGPENDGFSPVFSAFVSKLSTRDDEVRSQYAAHCAEKKRERESSGGVEASIEADSEADSEVDRSAPIAAHLMKGAGTRNDAADAATYAAFAVAQLTGRKLSGVECPMCGSAAVRRGDYGRECQDCGEIFRVPIVPENEASDDTITESAATEMPKPAPASMTFSSVFTAFIEKLATRDDEIRSQYEAHCAEERKREDAEDIMAVEGLGAAEAASWAEEKEKERKRKRKEADAADAEAKAVFAEAKANAMFADVVSRNDAADAATYASFAAAQLLRYTGDECPMCGSTAVWLGNYGWECSACGEIFRVPIVAENPLHIKRVKNIRGDCRNYYSFIESLNGACDALLGRG